MTDKPESLIAVVLVWPGMEQQQIAVSLADPNWEANLETAIDKVKLVAYRLITKSFREQAE